MENVFLLWHVNKIDSDTKDEKLIGVYSSFRMAKAAQSKTSKLTGFKRAKNGFIIDEYKVDQDNWTEGFITVKTP